MSSPTNGTTFPLAEFRDRLAAGVLDLILIAVVVQVIEPRDEARSVFLGWVAYNIAFWAWKHTTVGGIICQLRVVRANGQPFTIADAIVRGLSSIFSAVVVGLGYLWILRDPDFLAARIDTTLLDHILEARGGQPFQEVSKESEEAAVIAAALHTYLRGHAGPTSGRKHESSGSNWQRVARLDGLRPS